MVNVQRIASAKQGRPVEKPSLKYNWKYQTGNLIRRLRTHVERFPAVQSTLRANVDSANHESVKEFLCRAPEHLSFVLQILAEVGYLISAGHTSLSQMSRYMRREALIWPHDVFSLNQACRDAETFFGVEFGHFPKAILFKRKPGTCDLTDLGVEAWALVEDASSVARKSKGRGVPSFGPAMETSGSQIVE
jgi:hypothetical protein